MRFAFPYTHAYPGGRVVLEDDGAPPPHGVVSFNDGTSLMARWQPMPEGYLLSVPGHTSAKGTPVPPRDWLVTEHPDGYWKATRSG